MYELGLSDVIKIIIKRKLLLTVTTLSFALVSALLSVFVIQPVYNSKESIMFNPLVIKTSINPNTSFILSGDSKTIEDATLKYDNKMLGVLVGQLRYPCYDINQIVNFMNSDDYILSVLKLFNINIKKYDHKKNIKIFVDPKTNLVTVSVKYKDDQQAIKLSEELIKYLPLYIKEKAKIEFSWTEKMLSNGIESERNNLDVYKGELINFYNANGSEANIDKLGIDKKIEYKELYKKFSMSSQSIEAYTLVSKECESLKEQDVTKILNVQTLYKDRTPLKPISPNKPLNLAIGIFLGLLFSIIIIFVLEYKILFTEKTLSA